MALLLAMYQKLRLIRERNQLTLEMTQTSSKLTRIEKNIERTQKYYTSLFQQIDSQAKLLQSNGTAAIQAMAGLGVGSVDPYNYSGMNNFVYTRMQEILAEGYKYNTGEKDSDGKYITDTYKLPEGAFEAVHSHYMQNGSFIPNKDDEGNAIKVKSNLTGRKDKEVYEYDGFTAADVEAYNYAKQMAQQMQSQAQFNAQQMSSQLANNISIWSDAQKAQLECQQDAALEPLTYEQTMLELEKTLKENRLKRIESEIESYTQLADKGSEDMAPKFGLG